MDAERAGPALSSDAQVAPQAGDLDTDRFASDAVPEPPSLCVTYDLGSLTSAEIRRLTLRSFCPKARNPFKAATLYLLCFTLCLMPYGFVVACVALLELTGDHQLRAMAIIVSGYVILGTLWHSQFYFGLEKRHRAVKQLGLVSIELSSSGLTRRQSFAVSTNSWHDVIRIVVTREDLLFYFGHSALFWMPRRVFATGESESAFLAAANAWREWHSQQKASASPENADGLE